MPAKPNKKGMAELEGRIEALERSKGAGPGVEDAITECCNRIGAIEGQVGEMSRAEPADSSAVDYLAKRVGALEAGGGGDQPSVSVIAKIGARLDRIEAELAANRDGAE